MARPKEKQTKKQRVNKRYLWLAHYLDSQNPKTFFNGTESAKAAGYRAKSEKSFASIGWENLRKLEDEVAKWLDENGLSENALKIKLLSLFEGQETRLITLKGRIHKETLPPNAQVITSAEITRYTKNERPYTETKTVVGINVENKELQRRALDMAFKMKGAYAPEKKEHIGKNDTEIQFEATHKLSPELRELFNEVTGGDANR